MGRSDDNKDDQKQSEGGVAPPKSLSGSSTTGVFDLVEMNQCFLDCLAVSGLSLQKYSDGFKHIVHFFSLMGKIFAFVGSDVSDKVKIIDAHCSGDRSSEYQVIESVMTMEKNEDIAHLNTRHFASASRTLLRLHRAMEFIAKLFEALSITTQRDIGTISKNIYKDTLANYHPYMVRKAAEFGMVHGLPYKEKLMQIIVAANPDRFKNLPPTSVDASKPTPGVSQDETDATKLPNGESCNKTDQSTHSNGDTDAHEETPEADTGLQESSNSREERAVRNQLATAACTLNKCHKELEALYTQMNMHDLP